MNPLPLLVIILAAVALAFGLRPLLASISLPPALPSPAPAPAAARQPADCGIPAVGVQKQIGLKTIENIRGGEFWADTVVIKGLNDIDGHLVVIADKLIEVEGVITLNTGAGPGALATSVTLACPNGDVWIRAAGFIDGRSNPAPWGTSHRSARGMAQAGAGMNGGHIVLIGVNVTHDGRIAGSTGGGGGVASVTGGPIPAAPKAPAGSAVAVAGCGGHGGDVLICATEKITLSTGALIHGGQGGMGGPADTLVPQGGYTVAMGGDAGHAGDITFRGRGGACMVRIGPGAFVEGSWPRNANPIPRQDGGNALAFRIPTDVNRSGDGGYASASAGAGSTGGEIIFDGCQVQNLGTIRAGDGGFGGSAIAEGGNGWSDPRRGRDGGRAAATGGNGGNGAPEPTFPDEHGNPEFGVAGHSGHGGDASATAGAGGSAAPNGRGGASGTAQANGGWNGDGTIGQEVDVKSVAQRGPAGGAGWPAIAKGR